MPLFDIFLHCKRNEVRKHDHTQTAVVHDWLNHSSLNKYGHSAKVTTNVPIYINEMLLCQFIHGKISTLTFGTNHICQIYFPSSASYTTSTYQAVHHIPYLIAKQSIIYRIYLPRNDSFTISTSKRIHHIPYLPPRQCFIYHIYLTKRCIIYHIYFPSNASYTVSTSQAILCIPYLFYHTVHHTQYLI